MKLSPSTIEALIIILREIITLLLNAKKKNKSCAAPQMIQFYEKYVDNFLDFKKLFILKTEVKDYLELIDSQDKILEKMEIVRKKYKTIKKEIQN